MTDSFLAFGKHFDTALHLKERKNHARFNSLGDCESSADLPALQANKLSISVVSYFQPWEAFRDYFPGLQRGPPTISLDKPSTWQIN